MVSRNVDVLGKLDWLTVLLFLAIAVCGWLSVCGASADIENPDLFSFATRSGKQMVWIILAFVIAAVVLSISQNVFYNYAYLIYIVLILLLIVTIFVAEDTKGSRSWLKLGPLSFQPAEFAKFATALALAKFVGHYDFSMERLKDVLIAAGIIMLPIVLIIFQNETGSALVYLAFLLVLYREGMSGNVLLIGFCAVLFFVLGIKFGSVTMAGQPYDVGSLLVLGIIQAMTVILAWNLLRDKKLGIKLLILEFGVTLLGLSFSLLVIPFKVTWLQLALIILSAIYLIFYALRIW